MRKGLLITGLILILIGLFSVAYPLVIGESVSIPAYPNEASPVPPTIGSGAYTVSWSGGSDNTQVILFQCVTSACQTEGPILADISGASGSFTVTLSAGNTYALYENGTPISVTGTVTDKGITPLVLIGVVLLVVGGIVAALSFVSTARRREPVSADNAVMPPESTPAPTATRPAAPQPDQGTVQAAIPAAPQPTAGKRANLKCAHCGTWNEPWLTNCRKCQRTLTSTSS
jgi:hypothetical protein